MEFRPKKSTEVDLKGGFRSILTHFCLFSSGLRG